MAVRTVLTFPDENLKRVSDPVEVFDDALRQAVADLEETMRAGPAAVGIAAPQIGWGRRVVIIDASAKPQWPSHGRLVLINPEIIAWEGSIIGREGCLSVPDYTGNVVRAERLTLEASDERGRPLRFEMEGFEARVLQHEIDHLNGLLFIDRVVSRRNDLFRRKVYR
ncbi:MAG: peptide deformylase [Gammaproteobacteria bacterium]|nr:peptide deformylase [Gammaproteobacteria bacterium]